MSEATITFRGDAGLRHAFAEAARSCEQILRDFRQDFVRQQQDALDHDAWFRRQILAGLASANAGNLVPAAEVEAKFAARRAVSQMRAESDPLASDTDH